MSTTMYLSYEKYSVTADDHHHLHEYTIPFPQQRYESHWSKRCWFFIRWNSSCAYVQWWRMTFPVSWSCSHSYWSDIVQYDERVNFALCSWSSDQIYVGISVWSWRLLILRHQLRCTFICVVDDFGMELTTNVVYESYFENSSVAKNLNVATGMSCCTKSVGMHLHPLEIIGLCVDGFNNLDDVTSAIAHRWNGQMQQNWTSKNELELALPHLPCHVSRLLKSSVKRFQCKSKTRPKTSGFNKSLGLHLNPPSRTHLQCSAHCLLLEDAANREIRCQQELRCNRRQNRHWQRTWITNSVKLTSVTSKVDRKQLHTQCSPLFVIKCNNSGRCSTSNELLKKFEPKFTDEHHRNKLLEACTVLLVDAASTATITKINSVTRALMIISRAAWWHADSCTTSESLATYLKKEPPNPRTTTHEAQAGPQRWNASQTSAAPCHLKPTEGRCVPLIRHILRISHPEGFLLVVLLPPVRHLISVGAGSNKRQPFSQMPRVRTPSLNINFVSRD